MEMDALRLAGLLSDETKITLVAKSDAFIHQSYAALETLPGFELYPITFNHKYSPSIISSVRTVMLERNIVNVIFLGASELWALYFAFAGRDINLIIRHGTTKSTSKKDIFHRLIYGRVAWHIAICEHLASNVRNIFPFGRNTRLKVIYPSLRIIPRSDELSLRRGRRSLRILHVGRITKGKGHLDAIRACGILFKNDIEFELSCVGDMDPNYQNTIYRLLETIPYRDSIRLPGYTSAIGEYYEKSDIFLFPSGGEGLSNAFLEALAYGLLCIAYDNTSFPELHALGFEFTMVRGGDVDELSQKLLASARYAFEQGVPVRSNMKLAARRLSAERERHEYLDILQ